MSDLADEVLFSWGSRTNGRAFRRHVNEIDPFVEVSSFLDRHVTVYAFTDKSTLVQSGRGPSFKIEKISAAPPPQPQPTLRQMFNPDDTTQES